MKYFRFLLVAVIAFGLLLAPGCTPAASTATGATTTTVGAINTVICHPTAFQIVAANVGLTVGTAALSYATGGLASALVTAAIPLFKSVIAGYCAVQVEWDAAVALVAQAKSIQKSTKDKAVSGKAITDQDIQMLQSVVWEK